MSKDETAIEAEIQAKGLHAPRLTPQQIDSMIDKVEFHVFPGTTLTVCAMTLRNGFIVTGESAAASPENFNREIGEKIARENARNKIWALEGYRLRQRIASGEPDDAPWTMRLAQVNERTPVEKEASDLIGSIEMLGAHPMLTWSQTYVNKALCLLGKWHDEGEPGGNPAAQA